MSYTPCWAATDRLPLGTWNLSGPQEIFFCNPRPMFESSQTLYQGILHSTTPSATGAVPVHVCTGTPVATSEERIGSTTPMPTCQQEGRQPWIPFCQRKFHRITWSVQQRLKISEPQFDKIAHTFKVFMLEDKMQNPSKFLFRFSLGGNVMDQTKKWRWSIQWTIFKFIAINCRVRISRILKCWTRGLILLWTWSSRTLTSRRRLVLRNIKHQKEDRFLRGREIAFMVCDFFRVTGAHDTVLDYADLFSITLRDGNDQEISIWEGMKIYYLWPRSRRKIFGTSLQIQNTWVGTTQNRIGIVRHGDSSEDIGSQLSNVENHGEEECRSETSITKFWRQTWKNRNRSSG